jgi:hypothetical protein
MNAPLHRLVMFSVALFAVALFGCSDKPSLDERVLASLEASKQQWFDQFHPVGTAKSVKLHRVETVKTPDGWQAVARFTLYWEGPITKDGFTKIKAIHDAESNRWVRAEILETNGITNRQTVEGIGQFVTGFIEGTSQ